MLKVANAAGPVRAARRLGFALFASSVVSGLALAATPASAASIFTDNLVVSALTYEGGASTLAVGQLLPYCKSGSTLAAKATACSAIFSRTVPCMPTSA